MQDTLGIPTAYSFEDMEFLKKCSIIRKGANLVNNRILDCGCGNGYYSVEFAKSAKLVVGVDIQLSFLKDAVEIKSKSKSLNVEFIRMSADNLGFISSYFDVVTNIEVLEHVREPTKTLKEIRRVLKKGGYLILSVPNRFFPFETHEARFGNAKINPPIPFISLLPQIARKKIATARIYSIKDVSWLLSTNGFIVLSYCYMFPVNIDVRNFPRLRVVLRIFSQCLEKFLICRPLGMLLIVFAKKS